MKKFIALVLAMVMVLALCACGNNNDNKDNDSDASAKLKILDSEYVTEDYAIGIAKENTALHLRHRHSPRGPAERRGRCRRARYGYQRHVPPV